MPFGLSSRLLSMMISIYNLHNLLSSRVRSILGSNYLTDPIELVTVDNNLRDSKLSNLQRTLKKLDYRSNLVITRNGENVDCFKVINAGLVKIQEDVVITFSNHDVIYYTDAVCKVRSYLNNNNGRRICHFNSLFPR